MWMYCVLTIQGATTSAISEFERFPADFLYEDGDPEKSYQCRHGK